MKKNCIYLFLITFSLLLPRSVSAEYVLPYPSYMPGNKLYKVTRILDRLERFWYFGNIAQTKYHLKLSDKYLVEAKTLFEYNQYLLGSDALIRSDKEFGELPANLTGARGEGVDITSLKQTVRDAAVKHNEILSKIAVPVHFTWAPEKASATFLQLGTMIQSSQKLRESVASQAAEL